MAARRVGGDVHLAEDVTQKVFSDLAAKAAGLPDGLQLGGWLHRHTCFVSSSVVRGERRRQAREREAAEMNLLQSTPEPSWEELSPIVDGAIDELEPSDRDAVILRFFEHRDYRSIGHALGVSDDAAQKRVTRAVERLRELVVNKGVVLSAAVLATLLASNAVFAAPAGMAVAIGAKALAEATAVAGATGGLMALLFGIKGKLLLAGATAVVAAGVYFSVVSPSQTTAPVEAGSASVADDQTSAVDANENQEQFALADMTNQSAAATLANAESGRLTLTILAADSGRPVPVVRVDYRRWESRQVSRPDTARHPLWNLRGDVSGGNDHRLGTHDAGGRFRGHPTALACGTRRGHSHELCVAADEACANWRHSGGRRWKSRGGCKGGLES